MVICPYLVVKFQFFCPVHNNDTSGGLLSETHFGKLLKDKQIIL